MRVGEIELRFQFFEFVIKTKPPFQNKLRTGGLF